MPCGGRLTVAFGAVAVGAATLVLCAVAVVRSAGVGVEDTPTGVGRFTEETLLRQRAAHLRDELRRRGMSADVPAPPPPRRPTVVPPSTPAPKPLPRMDKVPVCIPRNGAELDEERWAPSEPASSLWEKAAGVREAWREGRSARPVLAVTYYACHGAISQHYSHLSAMVIAKAVGASALFLPHARSRDAYDKRNIGVFNRTHTNGTAWMEVPLSYVYDVSSFSTYMAPAEVHPCPYRPGEVKLPTERKGWRRHHLRDAVRKLRLPSGTLHVRVTYKRRRLLKTWIDVITARVTEEMRAAANRGGLSGVALIDMGCTDITVAANPKYPHSNADRGQLLLAHKSLRLSPSIRSLAQVAAAELSEREPGGYDGVHLRIEKDMFTDKSASGWWDAYHLMLNVQRAERVPKTALFIASGIFTYMNVTEQAEALAAFVAPRLYRLCFRTEPLLDVRPWVDFLLLIGTSRFFGHDWSSLSWLVVQERTLARRALNQSFIAQKKGSPSRVPACCETDRCLTTACSLVDHGKPVQHDTSAESALSPPPVVAVECLESGVRYEPLNMPGQTRSEAAVAHQCQQRCASVPGCAHFAFYEDGGCHLQSKRAKRVEVPGEEVSSGPRSCVTGLYALLRR
eukprot:TRINITY_DN44170_c0_g1_i1.p1 TRINITY_DN44170_c0_g1~~TRINITY_DN44170_c0_g1_i1.p1  ORF type:complete len:626 (+),score=145.66 TRINITY_DN44170_c0_g1_i1:50-1927(+)